MSHPTPTEWTQFVDGEVTTNRGDAMRRHAQCCNECAENLRRSEQLIAAIARPWAGTDSDSCQADVEAVLSRLHAPPPPARRGSGTRWLVAGGAVAAAAAVVVVMLGVTGDHHATNPNQGGRFASRGGVHPAPDLARLVGVSFFVGADEIVPGARIATGAAISAGYRNRMDTTVYALVFAIDAGREVHWLFPAYTDASSNPTSEALAPGTARWPHSVVFNAPRPGSMVLISIVSDRPLAVSDIETLDVRERTLSRLETLFPDAAVHGVGAELLAP